jgi:hypothetical protein
VQRYKKIGELANILGRKIEMNSRKIAQAIYLTNTLFSLHELINSLSSL